MKKKRMYERFAERAKIYLILNESVPKIEE